MYGDMREKIIQMTTASAAEPYAVIPLQRASLNRVYRFTMPVRSKTTSGTYLLVVDHYSSSDSTQRSNDLPCR
jgi:hypothetical protein